MATESMGMRWEDDAGAALERAGLAVIDRAGEVDYEGWGVLLGKDAGGGFAVVAWSYGSCSGCDAYEDMPDAQLAAEFDGMVERFADKESARVKFDASKGW